MCHDQQICGCVYYVHNIFFPFNHFDDDEDFMQAIADNIFTCNNISFKELNEKIFNPFEINECNNALPLFDIDPDMQYFNDLNQNAGVSDYFLGTLSLLDVHSCQLRQAVFQLFIQISEVCLNI